ncbi:MAG TPA: Ig-like domain-containing protein, partial [Candidatus Sulfomarinibacteraceae bacterium]|nr:Ig-like domain-containing protein [Candidatus Sulfomarinibacteraceae bacterium]
AGVVTDGLEIALQVVAPRVVATSPADGADRVSTAVPVTVDFSEPLDMDPDAPWGLEVLVVAGETSKAWSGDLELAAGGARLTWTPSPNLPSASRVRVTVDGSLRDRQGNRLEGGDRVFEFGVERYVGNEDVDASKIRIFMAGRDPDNPTMVVVEGEEDSVPANSFMWIEFPSQDVINFQANGNGAFRQLFDPADLGYAFSYGDTLYLHFTDSEDPETDLYVIPLLPWLTADGLGAFFNIEGGDFRTTEGVAVSAPWGAFPETGALKAALRDHEHVLPRSSWPSFAEPRAAARLELSVEAARTVQLAIPGEPPTDPDATFHACMRIEVAGRPHPMLVRTATWDPDRQAYVTAPADDDAATTAAEALARAAATGNPDPLLPGLRRTMELVVLEPILPAGAKSALAAKAGRVLKLEGTVEGDVKVNALFLDAASGVIYANTLYAPSDAALVAYDSGGPEKVDPSIIAGYAVIGINETLTRASGATVPLRPDDDFLLKVTDPDTGYTYSE